MQDPRHEITIGRILVCAGILLTALILFAGCDGPVSTGKLPAKTAAKAVPVDSRHKSPAFVPQAI